MHIVGINTQDHSSISSLKAEISRRLELKRAKRKAEAKAILGILREDLKEGSGKNV